MRRGVKRDPRCALVVGPPKSERSRRDVPIPPRIRKVLAAHLLGHVGGAGTAHIVTNGVGRLLSDRDLLRAYQPAVDAVDAWKAWVFTSSARRAYRNWRTTGATPVELMAILGHSDWKTSLLYKRAPKERLIATMERLSKEAD